MQDWPEKVGDGNAETDEAQLGKREIPSAMVVLLVAWRRKQCGSAACWGWELVIPSKRMEMCAVNARSSSFSDFRGNQNVSVQQLGPPTIKPNPGWSNYLADDLSAGIQFCCSGSCNGTGSSGHAKSANIWCDVRVSLAVPLERPESGVLKDKLWGVTNGESLRGSH